MHVPTCHRGQIISVGIWSPASVLARSTRHNGTFRRWPRHSAYGREPEASHSQGVQVTEEQTYLGCERRQRCVHLNRLWPIYTCVHREKYWQIQPSHSEVGRYRKDRAAGDAPKVQISSLNHASLEADDVAALAEFYTNVLGFKALDRPNFPFGGAWLQGGNLTLHIIQEDPSVPKHSHCWQVCFSTGGWPCMFQG